MKINFKDLRDLSSEAILTIISNYLKQFQLTDLHSEFIKAPKKAASKLDLICIKRRIHFLDDVVHHAIDNQNITTLNLLIKEQLLNK